MECAPGAPLTSEVHSSPTVPRYESIIPPPEKGSGVFSNLVNACRSRMSVKLVRVFRTKAKSFSAVLDHRRHKGSVDRFKHPGACNFSVSARRVGATRTFSGFLSFFWNQQPIHEDVAPSFTNSGLACGCGGRKCFQSSFISCVSPPDHSLFRGSPRPLIFGLSVSRHSTCRARFCTLVK